MGDCSHWKREREKQIETRRKEIFNSKNKDINIPLFKRQLMSLNLPKTVPLLPGHTFTDHLKESHHKT